MTDAILPGSIVGVLGSGQLGRMFAIAARRLGYRVHTYSPETDTPTGQIADVEWTGSYDDLDKIGAFARSVRVVTFEFENVSSAALEAAERVVPVRPRGEVLHIAQHRLREKTFLSAKGFPVAPFRVVRNEADLKTALAALGTPAILKTAGFGYDGKGQRLIRSAGEAAEAHAQLGGEERVLEAFVPFEKELSVVAARDLGGRFVPFGVFENEHKNHILDITTAPARVTPSVRDRAVEMARGILAALDVVGVMCVELFCRADGELIVNELAPRPHNSGHLTIDANVTSQFEQQLRAVCGLPLGDAFQPRPAAMANLLGDLWAAGEPNWAAALADGAVKLHLYGKAEARPGRKMGHLTAVADSAEEARRRVIEAREALTRRP